VQVDPIKSTLKPPGTQHLKAKYDKLLSNFAFKFNMRPYTKAAAAKAAAAKKARVAGKAPTHLGSTPAARAAAAAAAAAAGESREGLSTLFKKELVDFAKSDLTRNCPAAGYGTVGQ